MHLSWRCLYKPVSRIQACISPNTLTPHGPHGHVCRGSNSTLWNKKDQGYMLTQRGYGLSENENCVYSCWFLPVSSTNMFMGQFNGSTVSQVTVHGAVNYSYW